MKNSDFNVKYCFLLLPLYVFLNSCNEVKNDDVFHRTDDTGVAIATPFLWKTSLHQKEPMSNSHIKNPIIYNNNIIVPTTNGEENRALSLIDSNDGKILWDWDDFYKDHSEYVDIYFHYQIDNLLTYQWGSRSYCINLENGSTKWRHIRDRSFDVRIDPDDQYYFTCTEVINNNGYAEWIPFKGDIQTGIISEFNIANYTFHCPECKSGTLYIIKVPDEENLLLITYFENLPEWISQVFYGLYNFSEEIWLWDKVLVREPQNPNFIYHAPIIVNNKIYTAIVNSLVCHDLESGKLLWRRDFNGDFMFTGIIVEEGKVIANCEDTYAYALNAEYGTTHWSVKTAGTSSRMSYLNGVVYMVGGSGGGRLFAIEAATGKILWKIDAGLLGEGEGARFRTNAVYVLPAKDDQPAKVIALSDLYAYCFEAIK